MICLLLVSITSQQPNAATCFGSRQLQQYVEYECCKFGRGRMTGSGVIRRLSAQTRRGRKSALVHLQVERWRELKVMPGDCRSKTMGFTSFNPSYGLTG